MDEQIKERIESYLIGTLPEGERKSIEQLIANDAKVKDEFLFQKEMLTAIEAMDGDAEMKKAIELAGEEYLDNRPEQKSQSQSRRRILLAAAAIILLAAILIPGIFQPESGSQLFADNFQVAKFIEFDRGSNDNLTPSLQNAYEAYDSGNYAIALSSFQEVFRNTRDAKDLHYAASAALALEPPEIETAKLFLQEILQQEENIFQVFAHWNLALIACYDSDFAAARRQLATIGSLEKNKYTSRALALSEKIASRK